MGEFDKGGMPKRSPNLESRKFDDEFVVLDTETNQAHALEGSAALVWQAIEEGSEPDLPGAEVEEVVSGLVELGLVSADGLSRRTLLKVGAASALAGITSLALLPAAAMASTIDSDELIYVTGPGGGQVTVPSGATVDYTMIGGGGGSGSSDSGNGGHSSGAGGQGDIISGTIKNTSGSSRTLQVYPGTGGQGGPVTSGGAGGITYGSDGTATGPSGGAGGGTGTESGGGGGGASVIYDITASPAVAIVVAGGGGGGGGTTGDTQGTAGGTTSGSGTLSTAGTPLSGGSSANASGSVAGGGGAGAGFGAGGSGANAGGAEGASCSPNSSNWMIAVNANVASGSGKNQVPTESIGPGGTLTAGNGGAKVSGTNPGDSGQNGEAWFNGTNFTASGSDVGSGN